MHATLNLPRELTIYTVGEQRPLMLDWLAAGQQHRATASAAQSHWTVDASAVDEVDSAGLQLLMSLSKTLARDHLSLQLQSPGSALTRACQALGLLHLLPPAAAQNVESGAPA